MNDFIDLPHLPECLLGLPLETIHEIHSHTYHAIKADRQQRGEPVEYQYRTRAGWLKDDPGSWSEWERCSPEQAADYERTPILHDWHYQVRRLCISPQLAESHVERASRIVDSWPEWKRNYALTKHDVKP